MMILLALYIRSFYIPHEKFPYPFIYGLFQAPKSRLYFHTFHLRVIPTI